MPNFKIDRMHVHKAVMTPGSMAGTVGTKAATGTKGVAGDQDFRPVLPERHADVATLMGLSGGILCIMFAIVAGSGLSDFADTPSFLMVVVGTLLVTMISFSMREFGLAQRVLLKAVYRDEYDYAGIAKFLVRVLRLSRREGLLKLQHHTHKLKPDVFLHKCMTLLIDGLSADEIYRVMEREMAATQQRHTQGIMMLKRAADIAPAMGLIGTMVGLVQMLGQLQDPSRIGPAMAVALLTTFYGAVLANVVFSPLASKLERNSEKEMLHMQLCLTGVMAIAKQENSRKLEMQLNALLPPTDRISVHD